MDNIYKSFADPTRRQIVKMLISQPLTAGEIGSNFDMTPPSLSRHLNILTVCGLIKAQRMGRNRLYVLNKHKLQQFLLSAFEEFSD